MTFLWDCEPLTALTSGILTPFDFSLDVEIVCGASPTSVGVTMQQNNRPMLHISKTLNSGKRNCFQIDREVLAIVCAVHRLHKHVFVKFAWPRVMRNMSEGRGPYQQVRDRLTFYDDLLYKSNWLVPHRPLRKKVLWNVHSSHLGMAKIKSLAKQRFWWPRIYGGIEEIFRNARIVKYGRPHPEVNKIQRQAG